jgi:hypothetical protein
MTRDEIAHIMQDTSGAHWGDEAHFQRFAEKIAAAALAEAGAKREWVGLTEDEMMPFCEKNLIVWGAYTVDFILAIEAKLKEKNQ